MSCQDRQRVDTLPYIEAHQHAIVIGGWVRRPSLLRQEMQAYGTLSTIVDGKPKRVGVCVGVPDNNVEACQAAGGGWGPYCAAWYPNREDWCELEDFSMATQVIAAVMEKAHRLFSQAQNWGGEG